MRVCECVCMCVCVCVCVCFITPVCLCVCMRVRVHVYILLHLSVMCVRLCVLMCPTNYNRTLHNTCLRHYHVLLHPNPILTPALSGWCSSPAQMTNVLLLHHQCHYSQHYQPHKHLVTEVCQWLHTTARYTHLPAISTTPHLQHHTCM